jgi:hypothetical protein
MGGGRWFYYPTHIWTPAGGWYPNNAAWRRNTVVALAVIGVAAFSTFSLSTSLEVSGTIVGCRAWLVRGAL